MKAGDWVKKAAESRRKEMCALSDAIWSNPEGAFCEFRAAQLQTEVLEKHGFKVTRNLAGIETAFQGAYGSGKPVIGFVGEFDALADMSQEGNCTVEKPTAEGGFGHGCGHNLLGTAALYAAIVVKEYLEENNVPGTVIYFGCPAEERGCGKGFMTRDGIFRDTDAILTWHPQDFNAVVGTSNLASVQVRYDFKGVSAHAAKSPHMGRSALDGAELMNIGIQFLREHILPEMRIHYAFLDAGGKASNVVQSHASLSYGIRAPKAELVLETLQRVGKIARGAAMMTETQVKETLESGLMDYNPNQVLGEVMHEAWREIGEIPYSDEAKDVSRRFGKVILPTDEEKPLTPEVPSPYMHCPDIHKPVSNDLGDISYIVPVGKIQVACFTPHTLGHSWQLTAQGCTALAHDGMVHACKILALSGLKLYSDPHLVTAAKEELETATGRIYNSLIPPDVKPEHFIDKK